MNQENRRETDQKAVQKIEWDTVQAVGNGDVEKYVREDERYSSINSMQIQTGCKSLCGISLGRLRDPANVITGIRILCSTTLFFCRVFSTVFYVLYIIAGITDMIDGTVARMTHTESCFGAELDTLADTVFAVVCMAKLLPVIGIPKYIWIWTAVIAAIKVINTISGFVLYGRAVTVHSVMNKFTGMALFILPLSVAVIDLKITSAAVCLLACIAAIDEGLRIRRGAVT